MFKTRSFSAAALAGALCLAASSPAAGGFVGQAVETQSADSQQVHVADAPAAVSNGRVAYARVLHLRGGERVDIFTIRPDGMGKQRLTRNRKSFGPKWSPDGTMIAFFRYRGDNTRDIVVMNADGSNKRVLTSAFGTDLDFAWSPSSRQVAYTTESPDYPLKDVWAVDIESGEPAPLITDPGSQTNPVWSPDGTRIAYDTTWYEDETFGTGFRGGVFVYSFQGGASIQVSPATPPEPTGGPHGGWPSWSPGGGRLAYASYRDFEDGLLYYGFDVGMVRADGSSPSLVSQGPRDEENIDWRPYGRRILFTRGTHGGYRTEALAVGVNTVRSDGTDPVRVSTSGENWAAWSPDGNYILATRHLWNGSYATNESPGVWVMGPRGGNKRYVVPGKEFRGVDWQPRPSMLAR